jgi:hypothetical protein
MLDARWSSVYNEFADRIQTGAVPQRTIFFHIIPKAAWMFTETVKVKILTLSGAFTGRRFALFLTIP